MKEGDYIIAERYIANGGILQKVYQIEVLKSVYETERHGFLWLKLKSTKVGEKWTPYLTEDVLIYGGGRIRGVELPFFYKKTDAMQYKKIIENKNHAKN